MNAHPATRPDRPLAIDLAVRGIAVAVAVVLILWLLPALAKVAA